MHPRERPAGLRQFRIREALRVQHLGMRQASFLCNIFLFTHLEEVTTAGAGCILKTLSTSG